MALELAFLLEVSSLHDTRVTLADPCASGGLCRDTCDEELDSCFSPNGTIVADEVLFLELLSLTSKFFCNGVEYCDGQGNIIRPGNPCLANADACNRM